MENSGTAERARRELRRHYEGTLLLDGGVCTVRYVLDGASGRLLMQVEPGAGAGGEFTMLVPEERDGAVQVMLVATPADARSDAGEACDRWTAYHAGTERTGAGATRVAWVWGVIEAVKFEGDVCGGEEVSRPNALRGVEPRLCRDLNARRDAVAGACRRMASVDVETPLVVGVDAEGIDVRARFGIVRLEFARVVEDAEGAAAEIERLLRGDGDGAGA